MGRGENTLKKLFLQKTLAIMKTTEFTHAGNHYFLLLLAIWE